MDKYIAYKFKESLKKVMKFPSSDQLMFKSEVTFSDFFPIATTKQQELVKVIKSWETHFQDLHLGTNFCVYFLAGSVYLT